MWLLRPLLELCPKTVKKSPLDLTYYMYVHWLLNESLMLLLNKQRVLLVIISTNFKFGLTRSIPLCPLPISLQGCVEVLCACVEVDLSLRDRWNRTALDIATDDCRDILTSKGTIQLNNLCLCTSTCGWNSLKYLNTVHEWNKFGLVALNSLWLTFYLIGILKVFVHAECLSSVL